LHRKEEVADLAWNCRHDLTPVLVMLKDATIESLKLALARLDDPETCFAWEALEPLKQLSDDGMDVSIDLRASSEVGAPVIVAMMRPPALPLDGLSPRRRRVAELVLAGNSNKAIARSLGIAPATVKDHVHAVLTQLGFASRAALIAAALPVRS
jgi:two-component system nitrate/nitrite response regulator NarL